MKNTTEAKTENKFIAACKGIIEKMYVDKDAETKLVKPVIAWSILGGEAVLVALIATLVFLLI